MMRTNISNLITLALLLFFSGEIYAQKTNDDNLIY
jgi:hypothetical protein